MPALRALWQRGLARLGPPPTLRQRIRWLFLADGLWGISASLFLVASAPWDHVTPRALAIAGLVALASSHLLAYRRGRFPRFEFLAEGLVVGWAGGQIVDVHQITPLIYPPLFFRALYGSVWETAGTLVSYLTAYYASAALWPTFRGQPPLDQQEMIPNMIGMFMVGLMTYVVSMTSLRHERAANRERTLARAGAALVAATDQEQVCDAALEAVRGLLAETRVSRTGIALLDEETATIVAVAGEGADAARGARFALAEFGPAFRLDADRKMIVVDAAAAELEPVFGFALHPGTLTLTPLRVKDKTLGVLAVESPAPLPGETADALAALATEVALALDLQQQAFYDSLTQLANRTLFAERTQHALARAAANDTSIAVLFLDLDDFKIINDSLGHAAGDELLVTVARRLRSCVPSNATIARLGGDEFTVLIEGIASIAAAEDLARRISDSLSQPIYLENRLVNVSASIGIAVRSRAQLESHGDLLRAADLALYAAKDRGKAQAATFDPGMGASAVERLELQGELREAVARQEFELHYQPLFRLDDGTLAEFEALVRWRHPNRGLVAPDQFIPLAEQTGLIVPLGQWVLETACRQARAWQIAAGDGAAPIICVNLSARQLAHPTLVDDVRRVLDSTGLDPHLLRLEITESIAVDDTRANRETLLALRDLGVRLAVDDFGTGNSALGYLRQFPIDTLKIDRSFVAELGRDPRTTAMVQGMIALAKNMGLRVTGEGIESSEQSALLRQMGCDSGQGYLFARPDRAEKLTALLEPASAGLPKAA